MNQNCEYIHRDIAFGILTNIAEYMLSKGISAHCQASCQ